MRLLDGVDVQVEWQILPWYKSLVCVSNDQYARFVAHELARLKRLFEWAKELSMESLPERLWSPLCSLVTAILCFSVE